MSFSEQGSIFWGLSPDPGGETAVSFANRLLRQKRIIARFDASHMSTVLAATQRKVRNSEFQSVILFFFISNHHQNQWYRAYRCRVARPKARLAGNFVASGPVRRYGRVHTCDAHNASGTGSNASPHNVTHDRNVYRSTMKTIFAQGRILNCDLLRKN